MNKDEALKMAGYDLDGVIADVEKFDGFDNVCLETIKRVRNVIAEALEQPAQEPVAWLDKMQSITEQEYYQKPVGQLCLGCGTSMTDARLDAEKRHNAQLISCCADRQMVDVYTHPHQWQGLKDDEIAEVLQVKTIHQSGFYEELHLDEAVNLYRAIEQALKEKNT
jgi:hypothetical protein